MNYLLQIKYKSKLKEFKNKEMLNNNHKTCNNN